MSKTLTEIAQQLQAVNKKVQLIYAFNSKDKTRLSRAFKQAYLNRIIQFTGHCTLSNEEIVEPTEPEMQTVKFLLDNLVDNYGDWQQGEQHG